ncbi:hypothetical protein [Pseudomonas sp. REB1044]|uniref:hypothetical protein n=1 Tax=Pseudomonas sp. REB1044 TaxID=2675224 RepID=UPI00315D7CFC
MDRTFVNSEFAKYLDREFISIGKAWSLTKAGDFNGTLAKALLRNHVCIRKEVSAQPNGLMSRETKPVN